MRKYILHPVTIIFIAILSSLVFVGIAAANSSKAPQPIEVTVTVKEYHVEMSRADFPAGVPLNFTFINNGTVAHEAVLEKAGAVDRPLEMEGVEAEVEDINPGESKTVTWTLTEAGEYQLACHIPGHYEGGMVEMFTINQPGLAGLIGQPLFWVVIAAIAALLVVVISTRIVNRSKEREVVAS